VPARHLEEFSGKQIQALERLVDEAGRLDAAKLKDLFRQAILDRMRFAERTLA